MDTKNKNEKRSIQQNAGNTITNPTKLGRKRIKATAILKKRANLVRNLKKISKRRKK